ncbi:hypothetical protein BC829DRAFT_383477, partial [Chytridium lagenaria]
DTVQLGTAFEHQVRRCLLSFAFRLNRVGGADDRGIDLRGHWHLHNRRKSVLHHTYLSSTFPPPSLHTTSSQSKSPSASQSLQTRPIPVLVQCKYERQPLGPRHIREMEGVMSREWVRDAKPTISDLSRFHTNSASSYVNDRQKEAWGNCTLGIIASSSGFSSKAKIQFMSSKFPMMLLTDRTPVDVSCVSESFMYVRDNASEEVDTKTSVKSLDLCMNLALRSMVPGLAIVVVQGGAKAKKHAPGIAIYLDGSLVDSSTDDL